MNIIEELPFLKAMREEIDLEQRILTAVRVEIESLFPEFWKKIKYGFEHTPTTKRDIHILEGIYKGILQTAIEDYFLSRIDMLKGLEETAIKKKIFDRVALITFSYINMLRASKGEVAKYYKLFQESQKESVKLKKELAQRQKKRIRFSEREEQELNNFIVNRVEDLNKSDGTTYPRAYGVVSKELKAKGIDLTTDAVRGRHIRNK